MLLWVQQKICYSKKSPIEYWQLDSSGVSKRINMLHNPLCIFCQQTEETVLHIIYECEHVDRLWSRIEKRVFLKTSLYINFSEREILFCKRGKQYQAQNTVKLIFKYYIYKQRVKGNMLYIESVKKYIKNYYKSERFSS